MSFCVNMKTYFLEMHSFILLGHGIFFNKQRPKQYYGDTKWGEKRNTLYKSLQNASLQNEVLIICDGAHVSLVHEVFIVIVIVIVIVSATHSSLHSPWAFQHLINSPRLFSSSVCNPCVYSVLSSSCLDSSCFLVLLCFSFSCLECLFVSTVFCYSCFPGTA